MKKLLIVLAAIALVGCAGTRFSEKPPSEFPVSKSAKLNTSKVWPLKMKGTYLQKITATAKGKQQSFSVHLTLDDWMLEAVAFNDMAGRLYNMQWTPDNVYWDGSPYIPSMVKPEYILVDFLLAQLPINQLQSILKGARVVEQGIQGGKTRTVYDDKVLRTINYKNPIGSMWGNVIIDNPGIGYRLDIQTVTQ